ncbi:MAG: adenosylcobyric acid synthase [Candidatus Methanomethylophilaceae archaeon]|nr:adenosylcobyric acid synthase [Candidatus Methanomethylophilaceae archaeon]HIJ00304.1 cobyric acid synthase [Candidatus Methanomethylophilaceae archaeon]
MQWVKDKVREELSRGLIGEDRSCQYHPCHFQGQDCSWCFCPFYPCGLPELGEEIISRRTGKPVWSCVECEFLHRPEVAKLAGDLLAEEEITDPDDERLKRVFSILTSCHNTQAKTLMVLGATSDAGKSLTVTALCRILSDMGYRVAPFKSQNMSLNSFVTQDGHEISRAQQLQAMAARIYPDFHLNPILLKPKGDSCSQLVVEGCPFADFDVRSYYDLFVPSYGAEIVRRNLEWLRKKNDFLIMEGAGSPAEINIYDRDIANMGAARLADADCILVVNVERGGAFAYAYGTVMLLPEEDRKRIKGIIINKMYGDPSSLKDGIERLEGLLGIPVLGVVPYLELDLPQEDSMGCMDKGENGPTIAVIRLPHISNFTDFDALAMDGVKVRYVTEPHQLSGAAAVVIPGSKNTIADLMWLRSRGFDKALEEIKGSLPIVGICGGYQMMGTRIEDPYAIEGESPGVIDGLGLLDCTTIFDSNKKRTKQVEAYLPDGGKVRGYEIHMGRTVCNGHEPLFHLKDDEGWHDEGCLDRENKVMGSYVHGLFDLPAFRRFLLSFAEIGGEATGGDYAVNVEKEIDTLADAFRSSLEMNILMEDILGVKGWED